MTRRIKTFGKEGQIKKAVNEVAEAARIGIPLDTQVRYASPKRFQTLTADLNDQMATTLVDVCARNRKMELAETLFDDLFGNISSNNVSV